MGLTDEAGFTGAEKALITLVGLGLILLVIKVIQKGAETGANHASTTLSTQSTGNVTSLEPSGGGK